MTSVTLAVGTHVRHRKQAAWGMGVVTSVGAHGKQLEVIVAFDAVGEKRLRLADAAAVETMFDVVSQSELDARDSAIAAEEKAERKERAAQRKAQGPMRTIAPFRVVDAGYGGFDTLGDGTLVAAVSEKGASGEVLRVYSSNGEVLSQIELPERAPTNTLAVTDGLIYGSSTNQWYELTFARVHDAIARVWRAPQQRGVPRYEPASGVGALVFDMHRVQLAREDCTVIEIPWSAGARHIHTARWWEYDVLVGTGGETGDEHYFHWACVAGDGATKFGGHGMPWPLSHDAALIFDRGETRAIDREGVVIGVLREGANFPETSSHREPFAVVDGDVVMSRTRGSSVVRWNPRTSEPTWVTRLTEGHFKLAAPVRVGSCVAVTTSEYAEQGERIVWLLDAATGRVMHELPLRSAVSDLCPVGDDALVACCYVKNVPAWRNLSGKLERLTLQNEGKVFEVRSPSKDVVVTRDGDRISFFRL